MLKINKKAAIEEIEMAYKSQVRYYDPEKNPDHAQFYEELTHAYRTLTDPNLREEYDLYLASVGSSRTHDEGPEIDPEEIERRKRERGRKRFMDDFDFANEGFFNMWQTRSKKSAGE